MSAADWLSVTRLLLVPLIWPLVARLSPVGKLPLVTAKLYGPVPPVAVTVWL